MAPWPQLDCRPRPKPRRALTATACDVACKYKRRHSALLSFARLGCLLSSRTALTAVHFTMGLFSSNSAEKVGGTTAHVEQHRDHSPNSDLKTTSSDDNEMQTEFSPAEQKKILRRIDKRLIITVGAMYMVSLMDRTNLSNASIAGMRQELGMIKSAATPNGNPMAYVRIGSLFRHISSIVLTNGSPSLLWSFSLPMSSFNLPRPSSPRRLVHETFWLPSASYGDAL